MDSIPALLGLAFRAGKLAVGEEPVGTACRAHKAYLLLLAHDAADNTIRRAQRFCQTANNTICLTIPHTKDVLGGCLGRTSCAMLAVSDIGFAATVAEKLAKADPETYHEAYEELRKKADRAKKRKDEKRAQQEKHSRPGRPSAKGGNRKKKP